MTLSFNRTKALLLTLSALLLTTSSARAEEPSVPLQLQVDLTAKVLEYSQNPAPQSAGVIRIGILVRSNSVESMHFGTELKASLGRVAKIAGQAHEESIINWTTPAAFAAEVKRQNLFAVYVTPGLRGDMPAIAHALEGAAVVTVAAIDTYVPAGAVLGFELVSGRPKMIFNMGQAKKQQLALRAQVMKLMRIIE